jgi:hypothetical protein
VWTDKISCCYTADINTRIDKAPAKICVAARKNILELGMRRPRQFCDKAKNARSTMASGALGNYN